MSVVVIVTGGGAGIGEAICKVFARHGARVVVNGLAGDPIEDVAREIRRAGGIAIAHTGDVGTQLGAEDVVQIALDEFGRIDVVIANAGLFPEQMELQDFPVERFEELLHSNVRGTFLMCRAFLPGMVSRGRGDVINLASVSGKRPLVRRTPYCASKMAVIGLSSTLAFEVGPSGVNVNTLSPGFILSDSIVSENPDHVATARPSVLQIRALKRDAYPEDLLGALVFLASAESDFITGQTLVIDDGMGWRIRVALPGAP